jgi:hypothetical protein
MRGADHGAYCHSGNGESDGESTHFFPGEAALLGIYADAEGRWQA